MAIVLGVAEVVVDPPAVPTVVATAPSSSTVVVPVAGAPGPEGPAGPSDLVEAYIFAVTGPLFTQAGTSRVYLESNYEVQTIRAAVSTPPTGAPVVVDVNVNGATLFTTQANRPSIAPGEHTSPGVPDVVALQAGDYLTVDLDQVGSVSPGSDLTVMIRLLRTA